MTSSEFAADPELLTAPALKSATAAAEAVDAAAYVALSSVEATDVAVVSVLLTEAAAAALLASPLSLSSLPIVSSLSAFTAALAPSLT